MERDFASPCAENEALCTDDVAEIEKSQKLIALAEIVGLEIKLDLPVLILNMDEARLTHFADSHDAASERCRWMRIGIGFVEHRQRFERIACTIEGGRFEGIDAKFAKRFERIAALALLVGKRVRALGLCYIGKGVLDLFCMLCGRRMNCHGPQKHLVSGPSFEAIPSVRTRESDTGYDNWLTSSYGSGAKVREDQPDRLLYRTRRRYAPQAIRVGHLSCGNLLRRVERAVR